MKPNLIIFENSQVMAARLADVISFQLQAAITLRGAATIALSGGSTPTPLYGELSKRSIAWDKVTATLVDERWVPPKNAGSNEGMVRRILQQNFAKEIRIFGLWCDCQNAEVGIATIKTRLQSILVRPFDAVVMGMGEDGHTASWFQGASNLPEILNSKESLITTAAPELSVGDPLSNRITLTPSALSGSTFTCLLMTGAAKRTLYTAALENGTETRLPVRKLIDQTPNLWACWAPKECE